jgi:hypothetical protein
MQTVKTFFDCFVDQCGWDLLRKAKGSGFDFEARQCTHDTVIVKCTMPGKAHRFVIFEDHRLESNPHICNNWVKGGEPEPKLWASGIDIQGELCGTAAQKAAAIMCMTQTKGYSALKTEIFPSSKSTRVA